MEQKIMAKIASSSITSVPYPSDPQSMSVDFDENENIVIHVPEGYLATLSTLDFRTYTVKLAKI